MMRETVAKAVREAVKNQYGVEIEPEIVYPDPKFGDFATNVAFRLESQLKRPALEIAQAVAIAVKNAAIAKTEVAGLGFLNLTLNKNFWTEELSKIGPDFVKNDLTKGKKAQIEFISANPTGPLTLGNARGGFVGDILANVLVTSGYKVTREYYFNDAGTQIDHLIVSLIEKIEKRNEIGRRLFGSNWQTISGEYKGEYINEVVSRLKEKIPSAKTSQELGELATSDIFDNYINPTIERMGIKFDVRTNEKDLNHHYRKVLSSLSERGLVSEKDKALWLLSTKYGDERDRVLEKSSGDRTYLANDIAYHYQIFAERRFDKAIKVWGADHAGQIPSLKLTIKQLFPEKELDFVIHQWVRLISGGKEIKMSKRAGAYVTVDELLDQVPTDVVRWFFLMHDHHSHIDFDLDLAQERSQKNPFYYVMYAYVRAKSILREAAKRGIETTNSMSKINDYERLLIRQLLRLPELVRDVALSYEIHRLAFYGIELAQLFHNYYESERIIELPTDVASAKLFFLDKFSLVMQTYFALLGITAQDKM